MAHVMVHGTVKPLSAGDPAIQVCVEEKVPLVPTDVAAFGEVDYEATRATISALAETVVERMLEQLATIEHAEAARRAIPREVAHNGNNN